MTDDLVKRLQWWAFKFCGKGAQENLASDAMSGAADRIEELEKRGLVLEDYIRGLLTVVDDLEKVLEHFRERIRELEKTND